MCLEITTGEQLIDSVLKYDYDGPEAFDQKKCSSQC